MHPTRCKRYARAANSHSSLSQQLSYNSLNQLSLTCPSWLWFNSSQAMTRSTTRSVIKISTEFSYSRFSMEQNCPMMGRWRSDQTSSRVMVISPIGRWKVLVSGCHLSTKPNINPISGYSYKISHRGDNPEATTKGRIEGWGGPNFFTFLIWETTFTTRS